MDPFDSRSQTEKVQEKGVERKEVRKRSIPLPRKFTEMLHEMGGEILESPLKQGPPERLNTPLPGDSLEEISVCPWGHTALEHRISL